MTNTRALLAVVLSLAGTNILALLAMSAADDNVVYQVSLALTFIAFFLLIYMIPSFVAALRDHRQAKAIIMLNVALGWTFLGWIAALVWACTAMKVEWVGK